MDLCFGFLLLASLRSVLHQGAVFWVVRRYRIVLYMSLGYLYPRFDIYRCLLLVCLLLLLLF